MFFLAFLLLSLQSRIEIDATFVFCVVSFDDCVVFNESNFSVVNVVCTV